MGKKKRSPKVEETMQTLVDNLHAAFTTRGDVQMSQREELMEKRAALQKEKAALVRDMRNEQRRTQRIKDKTKLLNENDLIEAWSLRFAKTGAKSESESKKRKSSS
jgi:hypothetical protein